MDVHIKLPKSHLPCVKCIKPSANSILRHCTFTLRSDMKNMEHEYS